MTYLELYNKATYRLDHSLINLGQYDNMIRPLRKEIEPEKKTCMWKLIGNEKYECTCCKVVYTSHQLSTLQNYITDKLFPKFCPNCGAETTYAVK